MREQLAHDGLGDLTHDRVFLERLARDIERQVFRIHHALHKGEPMRQQVLVLMLYEHAAHVEVRPPFVPALVENVHGRGRDIEEAVELHGRVHGKVDHVQRFLLVVGQVLVKLVVLLFGHGEPGFAPQGGRGVHPAPVQLDGKGQEVGMLAYDAFQAVLLLVFMGVFPQEDLHAGAALQTLGIGAFQRADGVAARAVGGPDMGRAVALRRHGGHLHLFRHHEHGIKAYAEAPDDLRGVVSCAAVALDDGLVVLRSALAAIVVHDLSLRSVRRSLFRFAGAQELLRPGMGDGAQVVDHFLFAHADACVSDRQHVGFLVGGDGDLERQSGVAHLPACALQEAHLLQRVRSVGEQLP